MANVSGSKPAGEISRPFIASPNYQKQTLLQSLARKLYSWTAPSLSKFIPQPLSTHGMVRVICISDTHNTKPPLPDGDILLHAGDLSQYGTFGEIQSQLDWLNEQPHPYKLVIAGNHDLILDEAFVTLHPDRELDKPGRSRKDINWENIKYLQNSSVDIKCKSRIVKIYGSPFTPKCGNFGFQYKPEDDVWTNTVPKDTDIFLTHGPPAVHLDEGKGCQHLLKEIWRARPKLVVFGHIHGARGEDVIIFDRAQACYENALLGVQTLLHVFKLMLHSISKILGRTTMVGQSTEPTHLVNAAMVAGRGNRDKREAIIAYV